jgi:hypothetical protein
MVWLRFEQVLIRHTEINARRKGSKQTCGDYITRMVDGGW